MSKECQSLLIDTIIINGVPLAIEASTARIEGAAGFEREGQPSGTGKDFTKRKRVSRIIKAKIQFGPGTDPNEIAGAMGVQLAGKDIQTNRRVVADDCDFSKMGEIGDGSVDVEWIACSPLKWLGGS